MNYYFEVLKKYAVFSGRASRKEYWMFSLFNIIIMFVLGLILAVIGITYEKADLLVNIYSLAVALPSIAVTIRRMHDVNKSGWFMLIPFYNFILTVTDGTKGDNKYGPDPKGSVDIL